MNHDRSSHLRKLQAIVYLLEVAVLAAIFALADRVSPGFTLGPVALAAIPVALPLPCHLLLATSLVWVDRKHRPGRAIVIVRRPLPPQPATVPIFAR